MAARAPWMERPSPDAQVGKGLLLAFLALVMIISFVYVFSVSFSSYKDIAGGNLVLFPRNPTLLAYRTVLNGGIVQRALIVSAGITIAGTLLNTLFTVLMAYGLSRPSMPGSRFMLYLVLFTFLFTPGIIPNYLAVKQYGLLNSYAALILPTLIGAFNLVIMRSFFMSIPQELIDSARIDGASEAQILWRIVSRSPRRYSRSSPSSTAWSTGTNFSTRSSTSTTPPSGRSSWCYASTCSAGATSRPGYRWTRRRRPHPGAPFRWRWW